MAHVDRILTFPCDDLAPIDVVALRSKGRWTLLRATMTLTCRQACSSCNGRCVHVGAHGPALIAARQLAAVTSAGGEAMRLAGDRILGSSLIMAGKLADAQEHLQRVVDLYVAPRTGITRPVPPRSAGAGARETGARTQPSRLHGPGFHGGSVQLRDGSIFRPGHHRMLGRARCVVPDHADDGRFGSRRRGHRRNERLGDTARRAPVEDDGDLLERKAVHRTWRLRPGYRVDIADAGSLRAVGLADELRAVPRLSCRRSGPAWPPRGGRLQIGTCNRMGGPER